MWPAIVTSNFTTAKMDKDWVATHALPGVQPFPTTKEPNMLSSETIRVQLLWSNSLKMVSN